MDERALFSIVAGDGGGADDAFGVVVAATS